MKFSTHEDLDLPETELFAAITDFPRLERLLQNRGVMVRRGGLDGGEAWNIAFDWRGKQRDMELALIAATPTERVDLSGRLEQFELDVMLTVMALSPRRSRLGIELKLRPRGMSARLLLQAAKLQRAELERKFAGRIRKFVNGAMAGQQA